MKFEYWVIAKTKEKHFIAAEAEFLKRIKRYTKLNYKVLKETKGHGNDPLLIKAKEAELVLGQLDPQDYLVLLDERGKQYTSVEFSEKINKYNISSYKRVIFLTGGAFGFHQDIYSHSKEMLSLSKMTYSHQMIRTFFLEQVYRAFTILNNEKYHNE